METYTADLTDCPLPGDTFEDRTVIASGWYRDDIVALLTLDHEAPFYIVSAIPIPEFYDPAFDDSGIPSRVNVSFDNIVPAARFFDEEFGLWGEG